MNIAIEPSLNKLNVATSYDAVATQSHTDNGDHPTSSIGNSRKKARFAESEQSFIPSASHMNLLADDLKAEEYLQRPSGLHLSGITTYDFVPRDWVASYSDKSKLGPNERSLLEQQLHQGSQNGSLMHSLLNIKQLACKAVEPYQESLSVSSENSETLGAHETIWPDIDPSQPLSDQIRLQFPYEIESESIPQRRKAFESFNNEFSYIYQKQSAHLAQDLDLAQQLSTEMASLRLKISHICSKASDSSLEVVTDSLPEAVQQKLVSYASRLEKLALFQVQLLERARRIADAAVDDFDTELLNSTQWDPAILAQDKFQLQRVIPPMPKPVPKRKSLPGTVSRGRQSKSRSRSMARHNDADPDTDADPDLDADTDADPDPDPDPDPDDDDAADDHVAQVDVSSTKTDNNNNNTNAQSKINKGTHSNIDKQTVGASATASTEGESSSHETHTKAPSHQSSTSQPQSVDEASSSSAPTIVDTVSVTTLGPENDQDITTQTTTTIGTGPSDDATEQEAQQNLNTASAPESERRRTPSASTSATSTSTANTSTPGSESQSFGSVGTVPETRRSSRLHHDTPPQPQLDPSYDPQQQQPESRSSRHKVSIILRPPQLPESTASETTSTDAASSHTPPIASRRSSRRHVEPETFEETTSNGSRKSSAKETYCICDGPSKGTMVGCDNENCPITWYHPSCLGLKSVPEGTWYCPACEKLGRGIKKSTRERRHH